MIYLISQYNSAYTEQVLSPVADGFYVMDETKGHFQIILVASFLSVDDTNTLPWSSQFSLLMTL